MGGEQINLWCRIPNNWGKYSSPKHNSPLLKYELCIVTFFLVQYRKEGGEKKKFTVEKLDLPQVKIKVNINSDKSYWQYVPLLGCNEDGTLPLWFPPKTTLCKSNHEKNIRQTPTGVHSTKQGTSNSQIAKVIKNK